MATALSSLMIKQADPPSVYNQKEKTKHAEIILVQKLFWLVDFSDCRWLSVRCEGLLLVLK